MQVYLLQYIYYDKIRKNVVVNFFPTCFKNKNVLLSNQMYTKKKKYLKYIAQRNFNLKNP